MLRKKNVKEIVFTNVLNVPMEYAPKPSSKFIPEWYRKMESYIPKKKTPESVKTIKKCIPVFDAITAGYIIVSPCDVYVSIKDGEPNYYPAISDMISFHSMKQFYLHPSANEFAAPKWSNPWAIKTPPGYSCLFKPPSYNPNPWFEILEGVVDTDTFFASVNFPFVLKSSEKEFMIPAGTPIAQVIPFKRDEWIHSISQDKEPHNSVFSYINSQFFDRYKNMFWKKKSYK